METLKTLAIVIVCGLLFSASGFSGSGKSLQGRVNTLETQNKRLTKFVGCLKNSGYTGLENVDGYAAFATSPGPGYDYYIITVNPNCMWLGPGGW